MVFFFFTYTHTNKQRSQNLFPFPCCKQRSFEDIRKKWTQLNGVINFTAQQYFV